MNYFSKLTITTSLKMCRSIQAGQASEEVGPESHGDGLPASSAPEAKLQTFPWKPGDPPSDGSLPRTGCFHPIYGRHVCGGAGVVPTNTLGGVRP